MAAVEELRTRLDLMETDQAVQRAIIACVFAYLGKSDQWLPILSGIRKAVADELLKVPYEGGDEAQERARLASLAILGAYLPEGKKSAN